MRRFYAAILAALFIAPAHAQRVQYGPLGSINAALTADLSATGADTRLNLANTTLSPSVNTSHIWENFHSFVTLNGPGQANGEINLSHFDFQTNSGALATQIENVEAKVTNGGTIGSHNSLQTKLVIGGVGQSISPLERQTLAVQLADKAQTMARVEALLSLEKEERKAAEDKLQKLD